MTVPLFGAYEGYLKIDGVKGESQDSKHPDWIEVMSFSWGVSNRATTALARASAECASNEAKFSFKGAAAPKLMMMAVQHQPLQGVVIDFRGQTHVLQNAFVSSCQNNLMGDSSTTCTLNFTRCTTHSAVVRASMVAAAPSVSETNAQLFIDGSSPKAFKLVKLSFQGTNGLIILQGNGDGGFFQQALRSKRKTGNVTVKTEYMKFTLKEVFITSVQHGADGQETFTVNFASADGPPAGFQQ